jgi:hypothetical protein
VDGNGFVAKGPRARAEAISSGLQNGRVKWWPKVPAHVASHNGPAPPPGVFLPGTAMAVNSQNP